MKIVCLGDSITFGYGVSRGWVYYIKEKIGLRVLNYGTNGDTTGYMLERAKRNVIPNVCEEGDLLIVMGGANDCLSYGANDDDVDNILDIVCEAEKAGVKAIVGIEPGFFPSDIAFYGPLSLEKLNENYGAFADKLKEECEKRNYDFFDLREIFAGHWELFLDGVHPNEKAHMLIADFILKKEISH